MTLSEDKFQELQRLARLRSDSIISQDEFEQLKARILGPHQAAEAETVISQDNAAPAATPMPSPGWWRASDSLWYPPESHPDPTHRERYAHPVASAERIPQLVPAASPTNGERTEIGKVCASCGALGITDKPFCPHCGATYGNQGRATQTSVDVLAILASVFAIIGFFFLPIVFSTLGIVLGGIAWSKGSKRGQRACILSIVSLILGTIVGMWVFNSF